MFRLNALLILGALAACGGAKTTTPTPTGPTGPVDPTPAVVQPVPTTPVPSGKKAVVAPRLISTPLAGDTTKTTIHRLSNGMTVYIAPDNKEPTITAYVAVHAGGAYDPRESTGLAHYLEHMLFKGTSKLGTQDYAKEKPHLDKIAALYDDLRKPGADAAKILKDIDSETQAAAAFAIPNELDQMYSQLGIGGLNAFTNNDSTVYVTEIPKNRIAQWAHVEADRYDDAVFRLFWPELEAVYEEKNRGLDSPERRANEAYMKALFPEHGYGWSSVLGEIEHLKKPAYGDMTRFFNRYYTPGNMAILLAGDVDESVLPLLEKEFSKFKRPAGAAAEPGRIVPMAKRTEVEVKVPSDEGVMLGWTLVSATHPDRLPLELMDLLLLDGRSGILARDLLISQKVANAGCNPTFLRDGGYYELYADALDGQTHADLEKMLLELVGKLQRGEFSDADLSTAILTYEINRQRQLESNGGRMGMLLDSFVNDEDWGDTVSRIERMKKITKADIMRVAKTYLNPNYLVVKKVKGQESPPKITKPGITPVPVKQGLRSPYAQSILDMPVKPIDAVAIVEGKDYTRSKIATGDLVSVKNERNALMEVTFDYNYGRIDDKLACLALDVMKNTGAGKRTPEETDRALHELGLSIDTTCGKEASSITISGIDRNLDKGMELLREWLSSPALDDKILAAKVQAALTERANSITNPRVIAGAAQAYAQFDKNTEFLVVASNKDLKAVKPDQLKKTLKGYLSRKHRTSYFGPRDAKQAETAVVLGDGKSPMRAEHTVKFRNPGSVFLTSQETAQTQVWIMWPRPPSNDNDRAAGTLFSEYISPYLFQHVREARGLAYTVFGYYGASNKKQDAASVAAYVGTQGDKTHDAIDAVLEALKQPFDDQRLALAKKTIEETHRVDRIPPRAVANVVYAWEDQGLKSDPREERTKRVLALDKASLEKWTKTAFAGKTTVSLVGDKKKLDDAKVKKLGAVTEVPVSKLFGY
jgi:predicted Zn-dependent peptidase